MRYFMRWPDVFVKSILRVGGGRQLRGIGAMWGESFDVVHFQVLH